MDRQTMESNLRPVIAGLVILLTLIGIFGTAIRDPRPHDIPVGINAPPHVVEQLTQGFEVAAPGAFSFTTYGSEAEARAAIDRRDVVAGLVIGETGPMLIVAGAAGNAVSGGVTGAFTNAFRAQGTELSVEVVHPFQTGDAHGIVLFILVLAALISSVAAGALAVLSTPGRSWARQTTLIATYAVLAGILGALAADWLVGGYGNGIWIVMGLVALLSLAVGSVVAASARMMGAAGVALAALVVVLLGIVSSGGPLGSEFLPDFYRALAPWLPVAPAYGALRGALYFDGAGVIGQVVLLSIWAAVGILSLGALDLARRPAEGKTALAHV
jgi:hypothetical protein